MLWVSFTCNGGKVPRGATCVVATPYDNQARLIFDQLKEFIDNNPALADSIVGMTRNPYIITFKNGSKIKLFTAGTRSGAEGGSLRGQKADWLYMDEVDYMTDKDFETIYAISLEAPQRIGVMVASTPTGRRGMFFKLCTEQKFRNFPHATSMQDLGPEVEIKYNRKKEDYNLTDYNRASAKGWAEFYFPTMVNPEWSPSLEQELRGMYTQVAYEHEVLAEFGTEMIGVFNKDYIDEASDTPYAFMDRPRHDSPITIGIDWDKFGAATQIVVTQWDPFDEKRHSDNLIEGKGRFRVINRIEIPKGDFTYDKAVEKVVELDAIYNPRFIYPDRGAGEYQIEMLRKRIGNKVKGIHLGSSHEVRDPISRVFEKKPIKPFMVSQTTMLLERGTLRIPSREVDETIARQMTNYTVERVSPKTGEPTYSSDDEHALDAMMLSLLAFIIEMPEVAETIHQIDVAKAFGSANMKFVDPLKAMQSMFKSESKTTKDDWDEPGPRPLRKVSLGWSKKKDKGDKLDTWGSRGTGRNNNPGRRGW
jgi:replicative DNA helicase